MEVGSASSTSAASSLSDGMVKPKAATAKKTKGKKKKHKS